jgi:hypothetical protein
MKSPCCNDASIPLGLVDPRGLDELPRIAVRSRDPERLFWCDGDESMTCCHTTDVGQTVLATGRLELEMIGVGYSNLARPLYSLHTSGEVCVYARR